MKTELRIGGPVIEISEELLALEKCVVLAQALADETVYRTIVEFEIRNRLARFVTFLCKRLIRFDLVPLGGDLSMRSGLPGDSDSGFILETKWQFSRSRYWVSVWQTT